MCLQFKLQSGIAIASQNLAFRGPRGPGASKAQPSSLPGASLATARVVAR